jgi:molybdenum cofactor synthesis domain-containing protein
MTHDPHPDDRAPHDHDTPAVPVHEAKVLTVSDGVSRGVRDDRGGRARVDRLTAAGFDVVDHQVTADGAEAVGTTLSALCEAFDGLVVTTGGTGFAPRDQTPEGTRRVIEREAPGLAEAMRLCSPLGRLSRGVAGVRGGAIILNTPGSTNGCIEQLEAVLDVLPHALQLLHDTDTSH